MGVERMDRNDLIAPYSYNIVMEMEHHAKGEARNALIWRNDAGKTETVTYTRLMENVNKIGNAFLGSGLEKVIKFWL